MRAPAAEVIPDAGRTALVVGAGRSALALARFFTKRHVRVRVCDLKTEAALGDAVAALPAGTDIRLGGYDVDVLDGAAAVFASPGVPWHSELLDEARARGVPVSSEIDLFFRLCPSTIVGITGTNGKTTTTALTAAILERGTRPVILGGNIGETVLDRVGELTTDHLAVLELSSFQLESIALPRVHIAAVLNITPDHLDRHGTLDAYIAAKARIVEYQEESDHAVLNGRDQVCRLLADRTPAHVVWFDRHEPIPAHIPMPGRHNLENVLAAAAIARIAGVSDDQVAAAVADFPGVEHRLELVGEWDGVRWFNDSKATNPDAARVGLESFAEPVVLIAGGYGGGFDLRPWLGEIEQRARAVVLLGASAAELEEAIGAHGVRTVRATSLVDAVASADRLAEPGNVVLLSPGYKSFDMFRDFEDRGRRFKAAVHELKGA